LNGSALGVFDHYGDLLDGFVIDEQDRNLICKFPQSARLLCCNTVMNTLDDRIDLARQCLNFALQIERPAILATQNQNQED